MRFTNILSLLVQASIFQGVLSAPTAEVLERGIVKRYTGTPAGKREDDQSGGPGGPATSDFDSDDAIRAAYITPSGPSVFFSQIPESAGSSTKAYEFAQTVGGVIFRGVFPKKFTTLNGRSRQWYQDFADRFSGVFAEMSTGTVYVVAPFNEEIAACRVWNRIEFPTLQDNTKVTKVVLVDYTNFANTKVILGNAKSRSLPRDPAMMFNKRQDAVCYDWDGTGEDPECCVGEPA